MIATALGSIGAAALVEIFGVRWALLAAGAVLPGFVIALRRQIGALTAGTRVPEQVFELLRGLDLFSRLPMATVETLAVRCRPEAAESGAEIIRQGDHGDTFFVIEDGDIAVLKHGVVQRIEGPGEYFGEIALMHDTPRTATVLAKTRFSRSPSTAPPSSQPSARIREANTTPSGSQASGSQPDPLIERPLQ